MVLLSIMLGHVVYNAICFVFISLILLVELMAKGQVSKILTGSLVKYVSTIVRIWAAK